MKKYLSITIMIINKGIISFEQVTNDDLTLLMKL
jgi:hypothetical protein